MKPHEGGIVRRCIQRPRVQILELHIFCLKYCCCRNSDRLSNYPKTWKFNSYCEWQILKSNFKWTISNVFRPWQRWIRSRDASRRGHISFSATCDAAKINWRPTKFQIRNLASKKKFCLISNFCLFGTLEMTQRKILHQRSALVGMSWQNNVIL